jgi:hypothetical protein
MIRHPRNADTADLIGFAVTVAIVAGAAVWLALQVLGAGGAWLAGAAVAAVTGALSLALPHRLDAAYRLFHRAGRKVGRIGSTYATGVMFHTVVRAAGSTAGKEAVEPVDGSLWTPRRPTPLARVPAGRARVRPWAGPSRHAWSVFLLPFLLLVRVLDPGQAEEPPSSIYTLY